MKIACALFLLLHLQQVQTDSETLSLCFSMIKSSGFNTIPEYIHKNTLNDVTILHYDSDMESKMQRPDWINGTAVRQEWDDMEFQADLIRYYMNLGFKSAVQQFNQTGSLSDQNIYQGFGCCSLYPTGTYKATVTHAFNGKDFTSFDVNTKTFVAVVPQAVLYKNLRERNPATLGVIAEYYRTTCLKQLKKFRYIVPGVNIRKVPEVRIFQKKKVGSVTVTCHVTGFYPREVQVVWLGPDLQPVDEGVTEVLPNGDGTYQTRKSVIVQEEDVGKHTYSCVVLHISVPNNITTVWVGQKDGGFAVWILLVWILLVCISLLASGIGLGIWWRCKTRGAVI